MYSTSIFLPEYLWINALIHLSILRPTKIEDIQQIFQIEIAKWGGGSKQDQIE